MLPFSLFFSNSLYSKGVTYRRKEDSSRLLVSLHAISAAAHFLCELSLTCESERFDPCSHLEFFMCTFCFRLSTEKKTPSCSPWWFSLASVHIECCLDVVQEKQNNPRNVWDVDLGSAYSAANTKGDKSDFEGTYPCQRFKEAHQP